MLSGKPASDVSDMIVWHLIGSTLVAWSLIILYSQILFNIIRKLYQWSGILYMVGIILSLTYHCVAAAWLSFNDCNDTSLYGLAMYNTVYFFVYCAVMLAITLALFFRALSVLSQCDPLSSHPPFESRAVSYHHEATFVLHFHLTVLELFPSLLPYFYYDRIT